MQVRLVLGGADYGKPAKSTEGTGEISRNQGSELSDATIAPQGDVVAGMTRSEDKLMLIPGNAVGIATPVGIQMQRRTEG